MAKTIKRFSGWMGALLIIGALAFGASTALVSMPICGDDFWELGTCPPFNATTCNTACEETFNGAPGVCEFGCCSCLL